MKRWLHFLDNAGKGGVARTLLVGGFFLFAGLVEPDFSTASAVLVACFLSPRLFRRTMVDNCNRFLSVLETFGWAIFLVALGGDFARDYLSDKVLFHGLCAIVGLYLGLYFWLLSDPEIEVTP